MKHLDLICIFFIFAMNPLFAFQTAPIAGCDTLINHDGEMLLVNITRVTDTEVTYVKCNTVNNTLYAFKLADLREIKWSKFRMSKPKVIRSHAIKKNEIYKIWVFTQTSPLPIKGFLHHTTDSSLILLDTERQMVDSAHHILISDIKKISFRNKDNLMRGPLAGAFIGMCLGTINDFIFNDDDASMGNAIVVTSSGALLGWIAGAARFKFSLDGSLETFQRIRAKIRYYSLTAE